VEFAENFSPTPVAGQIFPNKFHRDNDIRGSGLNRDVVFDLQQCLKLVVAAFKLNSKDQPLKEPSPRL
jgi:hypothetical protein